MRATCLGTSRSAHSGQLSCTRLSVISIRKYCRRQPRQDRWLHPWSSGSCSAGCRTRHRGHSRSSWPPSEAWLADNGSAGSAAEGSNETLVGVGGWRSCCCWSCCCWCSCCTRGVPTLALFLLDPRLPWKRLWKEILPCFLPGPLHFGLGMPLTEEWGDSESFSDPISQELACNVLPLESLWEVSEFGLEEFVWSVSSTEVWEAFLSRLRTSRTRTLPIHKIMFVKVSTNSS